MIIVINGRIKHSCAAWEMKHLNLLESYRNKKIIKFRGQSYSIAYVEYNGAVKDDVYYLESHHQPEPYVHKDYEWVGGKC